MNNITDTNSAVRLADVLATIQHRIESCEEEARRLDSIDMHMQSVALNSAAEQLRRAASDIRLTLSRIEVSN